jgi:hypothetical protein
MTPQEARDQALAMLRVLCGEAWTSPPVRVIDRYPALPSGRVVLTGLPVNMVHAVRLRVPFGASRDLAPLVEWEKSGSCLIRIRPDLVAQSRAIGPTLVEGAVSNLGCSSGLQVEVEYTYGNSTPPKIALDAAEVLSQELIKACDCDDSCRLPSRVTSVSRQGVSWTLIDPEDLLKDGRIGIYEIDLALHALNPSRAKARAGVRSANHPPAERILVP